MNSDPFRDGPLREAVRLLFNAELESSRAVLAAYIAAKPQDPLAYSLSAAIVFYNFIGSQLHSQHGDSLRSLIIGGSISLPPGMRQFLGGNLQRAETRAQADLAVNPKDQNAIFALCVAEAVNRDVMALVFKRWLVSFRHAKAAARHAHNLLSLNPNAYDAYFVIGFSEHLVQEIPAIFRPFTKIPGIVGQNARATQFLEAAARSGQYFREFARQMLLTLYREEGRAHDAFRTLEELTKDFPGNPVYRAEWAKLNGNGRESKAM